jgi:hypothetical protein
VSPTPLTVLDGERTTEVEAERDGERVLLHRDALLAATGWERKPEGLCRGDICVPPRDDSLDAPGGCVDLAAFAAALRRPLVLDSDHGVAALGAAADAHEDLRNTRAPEFALPDLEGRIHRLSDLRGRKVLLAAYASW